MGQLGSPVARARRSAAAEALGVWAPLAHEIGLRSMREELEDISFQALRPRLFDQLQRAVGGDHRALTILACRHAVLLKRIVASRAARATIQVRAKTTYSIWHKMASRDIGLRDVHDVLGLRVLVDHEPQCYTVLESLHAAWQPESGTLDDYISSPKSNGYRSLHTTVIAPDRRRLEVQIRTRGTHAQAERGSWAHWQYKGIQPSRIGERLPVWGRSILDRLFAISGPTPAAGSSAT